ncbi:unnamed protein product [Rotaria magnacalcarata]|uniref:Saposin A-type domain-containing protein n=6 Tax=Rotaria magnacalcarata TaxID=392030 RepID=A0A818WEC4_9BILA|nr:unnamed protein product [Rotaria magnacalcarata]CAF2077129.1 unnamed protein product [Rotaria magnacalcarata]CAF3724229.1 unnamed protein product [Rotaria magnacalcarata]CAF3798558.1 unnamed protein product [Rotaria magnacalcarata]
MYVSLILSTIFVLNLHGVFAVDCPKSSAQWCENANIAQACGVTEQCNKYVWKIRDDNDRVNLTVYYETLCPDCRQFISTQVWNAYQSILSIVNISFVPYGNAHEVYRPETKLYEFYCQHGADECYGNLIHSCLIYIYQNTTQHLPFIYCTESTEGDVETVAVQCAEKTSIDYSKVSACVQSRLGNQLQHLNAAQTDSLQPQHQYVPWVTVNGVHTEDMEQQAEKDLIGLICKTYKGSNPPAQCQKYL